MIAGWLKKKVDQDPAPGSDKAPLATLDPAQLAAQMELVETDLARGSLLEAQARVERLLLTNPAEPDVLAHLGICRNLQGDAQGAVEPLHRATQLDPANVRALYFLGDSLAKLDELDQADAVAQRGLQIAPRDLNLLTLAGTIKGRLGAIDTGARLLNKAMEFHPEADGPLFALEALGQQTLRKSSSFDLSPKLADARRRAINRLLAAHRKGRLDSEGLAGLLSLLSAFPERFASAVAIARASLAVEPMPTALAVQLLQILWSAGDMDSVLQLSHACHERDPDRPGYRETLCNAWLATGDKNWSTAWRMLTESQQYSRPDQHLNSVPTWTGEKLGKKKLLVYQEQGMGDAVIGLRFLPLLAARGIKFDLWVLPGLADLAARASGFENLVRSARRPDPAALGYDYAVPLFHLIPALYLQRDEVRDPPVVTPAPNQAAALRQTVADLPGPRIGLVYGGNPARRDDWLRSIPLEALAGIARIPGASWVNLMIDDRPDKQRLLEMLHMTDPMPAVKDFADTAAVVAELDAVIAVDCSVAHIAGNLRKPLWVFVPPGADWRWQMGEDRNPWWPTARVLRSEAPGSWGHAIATVIEEVTAFVARRHGEIESVAKQ